MALEFSETNIINSVSLMLASQFIDEGYLIYWHDVKAVQIADTSLGWYYNWNSNYASYIVDGTFSAAFNTAKGLLMLVEYMPTEPRFVERPITVVGLIKDNEVQVPALSIEVGPPVDISFVELGNELKWWNRHLVIDGYVRNRTELALFKDRLSQWLKSEITTIDITDHDAGSLAVVGPVTVLDTAVAHEIDRESSEQVTYHVICNARLEYAA